MSEASWRPIETAPMDETWVLLWFPTLEGNVRTAFYGGLDDEPGWYDSEAASRALTDFGDFPTHWRPRPEPPAL